MKHNTKDLLDKLKERKKILKFKFQKFTPLTLTQAIQNTSDLLKKLQSKIKLSSLNPYNINPSNYIQSLQDKIEKLSVNDNNHVFLKSTRFWARSITWTIMGGTTFGLLWISIAKTDEIVIAIGKLEPKGGVVEVQMPLEGITREVLVKEGQRVKKNQVLLRLDTDATQAKNNSLQTTLNLNQTILDKFKFLVAEGAVSELQYIQQQERIEEIESQIKLNLVRLKYQEILSPVDGMVFDLQPKGPGFVARTSEPVLKIVPNSNLIAKVEIDSRTIGFVKKGKLAEISIDSFPASDFGVIEGKVTRIGSDALPPLPSEGKGYRFPAEITLNDQYLKLKSGIKLPIQSGMSLNANIKLRKVTYLQLLLNKFTEKTKSIKSI